MTKTLLLILSTTLLLTASDYIWSKDTQVLSEEKSNKIIQAFENDNTSELVFKNDPKRAKNVYSFKENIFVIGLSLGINSYSEEISNTTGSIENKYSAKYLKLLIGKDFTLWHKEYTQPSRLYFAYAFTKVESDVDFTTWSVGLRENMYYWSLYKTASYNIYPTASFEFGASSIDRLSGSVSGLNSEVQVGLTYARNDNFEYFINLSANNTSLKHPIDGIADTMNGIGVNFGINYKLMYGDFND
jgi:hypothetical protein